MEEYPEDQHDIDEFKIYNIFAGPLQMNPYPNRKWQIPHLMDLKKIYDIVTKIDRKALHLQM